MITGCRHIGWLLVLWLGVVNPVQAQLAHSLRLELASDPNEEEAFDVTPLAERGVLVTIRTGAFYDNTPAHFRFQKYDTNLKPVWQTEFKQDSRYRPIQSFHNDQYQYHLFREPDSDHFQFMRLNLDDGTTETFEGNLIEPFDIRHFRVLGNQAYVGGYHHNRPLVMSFSFFDRSTKVLPSLYVNHMEINSLEVDESRHEVHVLVHTLRRGCQFSVRTFSYDGKLLRTLKFDDAKNSLISGKLLPVDEHESLLVGNYSTDCTPYSQGIYVTRIRHNDPGRTDVSESAGEDIQYIEFSQLKNFFNYLKPRRQQKMLARVLKKKEEGKDFKFRYRLLVHDLKPTPEGLTLVAEVYYPQYSGASLNGGVLRPNSRYVEGFRYTHAFICGFDKRGKLLWDNCLPIKELTSPDLAEMVQVSLQGDHMVLAYPNEGEINTEVIQGSKVLKEVENYKLQTNSEQEKVTFSAQDNLSAWYDRHFLACGFQKIAAERNLTSQREVFYINKLTYNPQSAPANSGESANQKTSGSGQ
ncbi:hypothetical protein DYU11_09465 [Fibrisoma montanum]|uniref:Uncharacterized protein n=1 Tax=Fibrisoma montanum TaxID=2305895 RepID=A0A418MFG5_9BACT|nr:hypothetical protein [Fibrisoma montanum]RIV25515.1 hypothetical protein DYU11_09465 [Fibrisoma montanum]